MTDEDDIAPVLGVGSSIDSKKSRNRKDGCDFFFLNTQRKSEELDITIGVTPWFCDAARDTIILL